jgi:hypothetical protein
MIMVLSLDKIGLHRVSNPNFSKPAVSLHLYCPPFDTCKTFCEETGAQRASGKMVYFSENGVCKNIAAQLLSKAAASAAVSVPGEGRENIAPASAIGVSSGGSCGQEPVDVAAVPAESSSMPRLIL